MLGFVDGLGTVPPKISPAPRPDPDGDPNGDGDGDGGSVGPGLRPGMLTTQVSGEAEEVQFTLGSSEGPGSPPSADASPVNVRLSRGSMEMSSSAKPVGSVDVRGLFLT